MRELQAIILAIAVLTGVSGTPQPTSDTQFAHRPYSIAQDSENDVGITRDMPSSERPTQAIVERHSGMSTQAHTAAIAAEPQYAERDIDMLTRMIWGEARGCAYEEQALCVWVVLNRLDDGRYGDTIEAVVSAQNQFIGYSPTHPIAGDIRTVVEEVLEAWASGEDAPTLPPYAETSDYLYFSGRLGADGKLHNFFRENWQ